MGARKTAEQKAATKVAAKERHNKRLSDDSRRWIIDATVWDSSPDVDRAHLEMVITEGPLTGHRVDNIPHTKLRLLAKRAGVPQRMQDAYLIGTKITFLGVGGKSGMKKPRDLERDLEVYYQHDFKILEADLAILDTYDLAAKSVPTDECSLDANEAGTQAILDFYCEKPQMTQGEGLVQLYGTTPPAPEWSFGGPFLMG